MDELLDLAYQNHPKAQRLKPLGRKVIESLRTGEKNVAELAGVLEFDLNNAANKKRFYNVLRPLKNKGMIANRRSQGVTRYYLSFDGFRYHLDRLRKTGDYWLKPVVD